MYPKQGGCSLPCKSRLTWRFQHQSQFVDFEDRTSLGAFLRSKLILDKNARLKLISQKYNLKNHNFTLCNLQVEWMGFEVH